MKRLYKFLILFFIIIEFFAIILFVLKEINLKLFLILTGLSIGMIALQKYNEFQWNKKNNNVT